MIEELVTALAAEFDGDITFYASPPATVTAPSVTIVPGDPFLTPETQGTVKEAWEIWVAVSLKSADRGVAAMRDISLRVMRICQGAGAVWRNASGPRRLADPQAQEVVSVNRIDFKYPPPAP